jgi:hypothetical protein
MPIDAPSMRRSAWIDPEGMTRSRNRIMIPALPPELLEQHELTEQSFHDVE